MARKILVLFAHPAPDRSQVNTRLARMARDHEAVTFIDLYARYPTFEIDVDAEQERLRAHDVIVFLHPLYWYSTPALLKEWQDLVLEYGFAYGAGGVALHGKVFCAAVTAGGPESAYDSHGYNHFTLRELLRPLEQTALLCGMTYLPPFALFGARTAADDGRVEEHLNAWRALLDDLAEHRLDMDAARRRDLLNPPQTPASEAKD